MIQVAERRAQLTSRRRGALAREPCVLAWSVVIKLSRAEPNGSAREARRPGLTHRVICLSEVVSSRKRASARDPDSKRTRDGVVVSPSCEGAS